MRPREFFSASAADAVKGGIAMILGVVFGRPIVEAPVTGGLFAGLSTLAIVAAMNEPNGGLYMAPTSQYGRPRDVGASTIMCLESGPFLTMAPLGVAGLPAFPWQTMVGSILPLLVGMILGNLDQEMRDVLGRAVPVTSPFLALGTGLDPTKIRRAGLLGLGLAVTVVTGIPLFFADRLTGGTGVAGVAASATAGNDAAVPATVLVAATVVVTAIVTPLATAWTARHFGGRTADDAAPVAVPAAPPLAERA